MEEEIDKILLANFTEGDWQTARKQLLDLFIVSNSVCLVAVDRLALQQYEIIVLMYIITNLINTFIV